MNLVRLTTGILSCTLGAGAVAMFLPPPLSIIAASQTFPDGYSFVLPATDTSSNSQFLPTFPRRPIGPGEFVTITADGHFAVAGQRIRFFGTNLVADAAFPEKTESWFVAGRLRDAGLQPGPPAPHGQRLEHHGKPVRRHAGHETPERLRPGPDGQTPGRTQGQRDLCQRQSACKPNVPAGRRDPRRGLPEGIRQRLPPSSILS